MSRGLIKFSVAALVLLTLVLGAKNVAFAALRVDITQGNIEPIPIAIDNFTFAAGGENGTYAKGIAEIIERDLEGSGLFRAIDRHAFIEPATLYSPLHFVNWRQINATSVVAGNVKSLSSREFQVEFKMWDPYIETENENGVFTFDKKNWRSAAHKISDKIFKRLTGEPGYFDTRILMVSEAGPRKQRKKRIAIMDQDGANFHYLTDGKYMVLTPRFNATLDQALYMSYEGLVPKVYLINIATGKHKLVGDFPGMSFAPRFSPNGEKAIMSVAEKGTTDIYELHLQSGYKRQLTNSPHTINTSPCYSPDGERIVFNSDRGGAKQLYVMNSDGSNVHRISFGEGIYSAPVWSPRGDFIAFSKTIEGRFYIGVMRPDGSGERLLTTSWLDEGPTWSPNGRIILFARQTKDGVDRIYAVDLTGYNERQVATPTEASDPAWSP
jgi:TolB protein